MSWSFFLSRMALGFVVLSLSAPFLWAQTLRTAPAFNIAVPGQTGAQPEGAWRNFVGWICNVIAPIDAGGAVFGAVMAFMSRPDIWTVAAWCSNVAGKLARRFVSLSAS